MSGQFEKIDRGGLVCEVHLLVRSHWLMLPTDLGYCDRRGRWWYDSTVLCGHHKRMVEQILTDRESRVS